MKVANYSYEIFPEYNEEVDGMMELNGDIHNIRVRMVDIEYQPGLIVRFLLPNNILDEEHIYPLVIHVQGSGWYKQDMSDHIFDFMPIVKAGFVYAIVEYHAAPDYKFPTQIIDTKKAIRYIMDNYSNYPIDINNVFLSGDSSGGHTALMTLFDYNQHIFDDCNKPLVKLRGMIDLYGAVNLLTMDEGYSKYDHRDGSNCKDLFGEENINNISLFKKASPINMINNNLQLPPILILHGSKDHVVPFNQSVELYNKLRKFNFNVTLCKVKGADHGRSIFYVEDVYRTIISFLESNLL